MPLSIPLPAHAKVIINGAVIENSGGANITLTVHNKANILRDKDVITQAEADTPAKEIYHSIQNAYLFEANKDEWMAIARALLEQFQRIRPNSAPITTHILELLAEDKLYNALRASRRLIGFESEPPPAPTPPPPPAPLPAVKRSELDEIREQMALLQRRIAELDPG